MVLNFITIGTFLIHRRVAEIAEKIFFALPEVYGKAKSLLFVEFISANQESSSSVSSASPR